MEVPLARTVAVASLALAACASRTGAPPSAGAGALEHAPSAGLPEAQPSARVSHGGEVECNTCNPNGACWSSLASPGPEDIDAMETHRAMAAARRLASPSLRHAEACACSAVSTVDRDVSPFYHRADIWGVRPAYEHISGKHPRDRLVGAVVTFHGVPGMTTESLQRVIDCHLARNDALGNDVPEMPYCPLVPSGVTAQVRTVPGGAFAVSLESRDPKTGKEILRRARALGGQ